MTQCRGSDDITVVAYTEEIDEGPGVSNKIYNKCEDITLTTQLVATKLNQLNISKSPGPDLIHPRVLYEIRDVIAYPLKLLFERSLEIGQLPCRVLSLSDRRYSLNPLSQTRID